MMTALRCLQVNGGHSPGLIPPAVTLADVHVFHDDWCAHFAGASCNCDPNLGLKRASEWKLAPGPLRDV
jgi:hypothetical protein